LCANKYKWQIITNDQTRKFLAVKTGLVKMILYTRKGMKDHMFHKYNEVC
jgi:hypothetical protein